MESGIQSKPRVLVIDDDTAVRTMVCRALKSFGHEVVESEGGEEGLTVARATRPDLVVCDVCMPGWDGYEVLERLREQPETAAVPVILMTGNLAEAGMRRSMDAGADDYLPKPFTMDALKRAAEAQLLKSRRRVEAEHDIETRLRAIINATTDLIGIFDAEGQKLVYLNRAGRRLVGYDLEERLDLTLAELHPEGTLELLVHEAFPTALKEGSWHGEMQLRCRDGKERVLSQVVLAHRRANGEIDCFSTLARDITERKEAERLRDLRELQVRQTQKLESIGQLAAGIAHEINTPTQYVGDNLRFLREGLCDLAAVCSRAQELAAAAREQGLLGEAVKAFEQECERADAAYLLEEMPKASEQALEGVERIAKIVRAMKEFSHPGSSERVAVDLNRAIESTLTVTRNEWKYHAELVLNLDPDLPHVPVLPDEFNQLMLNLIVNAGQAMGEGGLKSEGQKGVLEVTTARDGEWVEVRVRDTGPGIPEQIRARIFDPFFTTKPVGCGTGQGLAIARSVVVDKHRGTIGFESEAGRGTVFIVRLPLQPEASEAEEER